MARSGVDHETFLRIWQSSPSAEVAARRLGMPASRASNVAACFRRAGIPLRDMRTRRAQGARVVGTGPVGLRARKDSLNAILADMAMADAVGRLGRPEGQEAASGDRAALPGDRATPGRGPGPGVIVIDGID